MKIHTTIGIYPNGEYRSNGVLDEHLSDHIEYNKTYRAGRALIVDGVVVYTGNVSERTIASVLSECTVRYDKCTVPYH